MHIHMSFVVHSVDLHLFEARTNLLMSLLVTDIYLRVKFLVHGEIFESRCFETDG